MSEVQSGKILPELSAGDREAARHYIPLAPADTAHMLQTLGLETLDDLFAHVPKQARFTSPLPVPEELDGDAARERLGAVAARNQPLPGFLGDGLPAWKVHPIVAEVAGLRRLATSYTPYQPERSQGTLVAHWIYQSLMARLTGFEAVNSSLYERATALVEAALCALRVVRGSTKVAVSSAIYPGDLEVLETHLSDTPFELVRVPVNPRTGRMDPGALASLLANEGGTLAAFAFPQVNTFGLLEDVDGLTLACAEAGVLSIGIVDPTLLGTGGLKAPVDFGGRGCDIVVGEAQTLAIGPNFGGPGLGLFAVRHNEETKNLLRSTPGRFVGKAVDHDGFDGRVMVLSTREQHIRKDKATSNICSNQAFLASLAGASLLAKGEAGFSASIARARDLAVRAYEALAPLRGIRPAFAGAPFFNEFTLEVDRPVSEILEAALAEGFLAGCEVSNRLPNTGNLWKLTFTDTAEDEILEQLVGLCQRLGHAPEGEAVAAPELPPALVREKPLGLPDHGHETVLAYYRRLDTLNAAPEESCYPLGSCTMKYNPYLNEWGANLPGFTDIHPQAPEALAQGSLEVLHEIQEWFRDITGLAGVTTQPVAGAQGELVGLKLFQAYHRSRGDTSRDVVLIPKSAHGTNFATAKMAGFHGRDAICLLDADSTGRVNLDDLRAKVASLRDRLAGVMITNPNTGGILEENFAEIAGIVHEAGGLVYMDGANLNAIAGRVDLGAIGVDAVHSNLHKTWTIPHGGGGPGDAIVAVSERLVDFLPGRQVVKQGDRYTTVVPPRTIGSFHRHWGNFAHKVRCYAYLLRLGREGIPRMSGTAVLAARYLQERLRPHFPLLPKGTESSPRMHEFILTLTEEQFDSLSGVGLTRAQAIPAVGKVFLDFGYHAPTVAFPEALGLMFEPTESHTLAELDRLADTAIEIGRIILEEPEIVKEAPLLGPVRRFDEVAANREPVLFEALDELPPLPSRGHMSGELVALSLEEVRRRLEAALPGRGAAVRTS